MSNRLHVVTLRRPRSAPRSRRRPPAAGGADVFVREVDARHALQLAAARRSRRSDSRLRTTIERLGSDMRDMRAAITELRRPAPPEGQARWVSPVERSGTPDRGGAAPLTMAIMDATESARRSGGGDHAEEAELRAQLAASLRAQQTQLTQIRVLEQEVRRVQHGNQAGRRGPQELREQQDRQDQQRNQLQSQIDQLEAQVAEYQSREQVLKGAISTLEKQLKEHQLQAGSDAAARATEVEGLASKHEETLSSFRRTLEAKLSSVHREQLDRHREESTREINRLRDVSRNHAHSAREAHRELEQLRGDLKHCRRLLATNGAARQEAAKEYAQAHKAAVDALRNEMASEARAWDDEAKRTAEDHSQTKAGMESALLETRRALESSEAKEVQWAAAEQELQAKVRELEAQVQQSAEEADLADQAALDASISAAAQVDSASRDSDQLRAELAMLRHATQVEAHAASLAAKEAVAAGDVASRQRLAAAEAGLDAALARESTLAQDNASLEQRVADLESRLQRQGPQQPAFHAKENGNWPGGGVPLDPGPDAGDTSDTSDSSAALLFENGARRPQRPAERQAARQRQREALRQRAATLRPQRAEGAQTTGPPDGMAGAGKSKDRARRGSANPFDGHFTGLAKDAPPAVLPNLISHSRVQEEVHRWEDVIVRLYRSQQKLQQRIMAKVDAKRQMGENGGPDVAGKNAEANAGSRSGGDGSGNSAIEELVEIFRREAKRDPTAQELRSLLELTDAPADAASDTRHRAVSTGREGRLASDDPAMAATRIQSTARRWLVRRTQATPTADELFDLIPGYIPEKRAAFAEMISRLGVDCVDGDGNQALHLAVQYRQAELVEMILQDYGADANARNGAGVTPIVIACYVSCWEPAIIRLLIKFGARPDFAFAEGLTAAHYAVASMTEGAEGGLGILRLIASCNIRSKGIVESLLRSANLGNLFTSAEAPSL